MPLSNPGLQAALSGWTDEVFLECLTFTHPSATTLRLISDRVDHVRTAGTFVGFPFEFRLHTEADDRVAEAEIVADNVDQRIVQELRGLTGEKPQVMYEIVLASSVNTIEFGPMTFEAQGFNVNIGTISLTISFAFSILNEAYPKDYFAPWNRVNA